MEIEPVEIHTMNKLWFDFYSRILYPQRLAEEDLHPKGCTIPGCDHQSEACPDPLHPEGCTMFSCRHPWNDQCKTKAQEMWQWEDFVLQFYRPPAQGKTVAAELGLV